MSPPIELSEYERRVVTLEPDVARALAAVGRDRMRVVTDAEEGRYRLEATQWVGSIVAPGGSVLIRPKVPIDNVFLLLEAVDAPEWQAETFGWDTRAGLLPAFAAFFARTLERAIGAGLYRTYRAEEERVPALRGRLDLVALIRHPGSLVPVPCRFDEFTADVPENWVMKAAVRRLLRTPGVPQPVRRRLLHLLMHFAEVTDLEPDPAIVDRMHFHRLNERFKPSLRLAQLVLRNVTLAADAGDRTASSFLVDMNALFQRFVTQRLAKLLRRRLDVRAEPPGWHLDRGRRVGLWPDLVFERDGVPVYVGDTKYKLLGDQLARNADYYQMLAYTTGLELSEGVLIYCSADGGEPDRCIEVPHTHKRLWTYKLDLSGTSTDMDSSLADLATWIESHVEPRLEAAC